MSDLDADLYGDLYGDESEFVVPTDAPKEPTKAETTAPAAPSTTSTTTVPKPSPTPDVKSPVETYKPEPFNGGPTSTPTPPVKQETVANLDPQDYQTPQYSQIATYTEPEPQPISSSLSIMDRHVRPSEMKEEGKMFIGGLNWDTTDEGLKKYFEQFGKVEACTIMRDATGRSRCFAFLTFEDPASVNAVMVREHYLDGKIIDPKRAIPRQEHQRAQKLFIGGLAGTVTSESMREFFSQFGKVIDSTVMLDRETGRSKGFGFVSFENVDVEPILGFGKLEIDGKLIDIKLAQPRHQRDGQQTQGGNYREGGYTQGGGYNQGSYAGGGVASSAGGMGQGTSSGTAAASASASATGAGTGATGSTPFDPQALAALYTRMFQQFGAMGAMGMGGMGMGMGGMGGMGMGGMGMGAGMGNMGMGRAGASGMNPSAMGAGMGAGGSGTGMGAGRGVGMSAQGGPINAPRGPRGAPTGPSAGGGTGPQRSSRGGHGYHPYSR